MVTELEFSFCYSWIKNQFLHPTNQKICKSSIFHELVFAKCNNFERSNACDKSVFYLELNEWDWTMKEKKSVEYFLLF